MERVFQSRSRYIVGPAYDWIFFLLPPLLSLVVGFLVFRLEPPDALIGFWGQELPVSIIAIGIVIHAHLVIVFFRSHANPGIFRLNKVRFVIAPPLLLAAMMSSAWILLIVSVLATFWDVYHSGMQTFGFARIYDSRAGNDPIEGRRLDWMLNQFLYAGPILAGATMMEHFNDFEDFEEVGSTFLTSIPGFMESGQPTITWVVLATGTAFLGFYLFAQFRQHALGRAISFPKIFITVSTGFVSIAAWGFNTWGEAFLIMNLFHAWQYFGLVWATEKANMMRLFSAERLPGGKAVTAAIFLGLAFGYGYAVQTWDADYELLLGITLVVSIMHFWYDGFIWSVRKAQV